MKLYVVWADDGAVTHYDDVWPPECFVNSYEEDIYMVEWEDDEGGPQ